MDMKGFLRRHALPEHYATIAQQWFMPLGEEIASHQKSAKQTFFVGVNGCQGSGKSTLCDYLVDYLIQEHNLNCISLSLDDFYLDQSARNALAIKVHPLLKTRGVPGTHDVALANQTFDKLASFGTVSIPRFDKSTDNPFPVSQWPITNGPVDVVIVEGWCWGVSAQLDNALNEPVNDLESEQDSLGTWRRYVNRQIKEYYQSLFDRMDYWAMLKGPSFEHVYKWRCEQEHKLAKQSNGAAVMSDDQIASFIQHYQRLTEHCLESLPDKCDTVFELDENRQISHVQKKATA